MSKTALHPCLNTPSSIITPLQVQLTKTITPPTVVMNPGHFGLKFIMDNKAP